MKIFCTYLFWKRMLKKQMFCLGLLGDMKVYNCKRGIEEKDFSAKAVRISTTQTLYFQNEK